MCRTSSSQWERVASITTALMVIAVLAAGCAGPAWTQWGGPDRDFRTRADGLAAEWPEDGPNCLWRRELGDGFSTIVTDGRTLYTMYRKDDAREAVVALDAETGQTRWEFVYDAPYIEVDEKNKQTTEFGTGPNATPLLIGNRLYTVGFTSRMHCLDTAGGRVIWSHDLYHDFGGTLLPFGYAASPIAYGNNVVVLVGGEGRGVMALDQATGDVAWQSTDSDCSYSSPILINVDGQNHLVAYMAGEVIGISPDTGEQHWSLRHANQFNTSICTPIWCPDNVLYFVTGGDEAGGRAVRLVKNGSRIRPEELWHNKRIGGSLNNSVRIGNYLYGDGGGRVGKLIAFDVRTGEIAWQQRGFPRIKSVYAAGAEKLVLLDEDGHLILASADPGGLDVLARAKLLEKPAWTAPTMVGTRVYLRDRKTIMAVDLG